MATLSQNNYDYIVIEPAGEHTCTIIWLHGLDDNNMRWVPLAEGLKTQFPYIKWILLQAPLRPVSYVAGKEIHAWYNMPWKYTYSTTEDIDENGMLASIHMVDSLIASEVAAGMNNVILGGYSQGCSTILLTSLVTRFKLTGIIGFSGWLPRAENITSKATGVNMATPLFLAHGSKDGIVKYSFGTSTARHMIKMGYHVEFKTYHQFGHYFENEQRQDLIMFLQRCQQNPTPLSKL